MEKFMDRLVRNSVMAIVFAPLVVGGSVICATVTDYICEAIDKKSK